LSHFLLDAMPCGKYSNDMAFKKNTHNLTKSTTVAEIPAACSDELAAVEFFEKQRWGNTPPASSADRLPSTR